MAVILTIFGIYCYMALPREAAPDITIPNVFVSTSYRGVSPADMETAVTIEIEKKLKGLDGLKKLQSVSSEGLSSINIEFVTGTDIDQAIQDVKDKVDQAKGNLPSDLENDPSVFEVNFSEMPIIVFSLSGTCGLPCLKEIADDLEDDIESVTGILEVDVTGGLEREIRVEVFPEKLSYYGLSIASLQNAVKSENSNTSGGAIRLGQGRFQLRVPGEFTTPEEIYGLVLGVHQGQPVYLKDVARVVDGFKEETSRSRLDGRSAVNLSVKKRTGENIIRISQDVDRIVDRDRLTWPPGTEITKVMDASKDIQVMVEDLDNNILSGLVLVLLVVFVTMGIRNALLVSMAIPLSMLISFTVLYVMGISLNMVVLFSLTLALGMLVDNAIVIVENIYRYVEQGVPRVEAAMRATGEVAWPVIGSTLTTVGAFLPLMFWPGIMGEFMGYLPQTLIITLSASLFVALVINPAIASLFIKPKTQVSHQALTGEELLAMGEKPVDSSGPVLRKYKRLLNLSLRMPLTFIGLSFLSLILMIEAWVFFVGLEKPLEFMPEIDPKSIYVNLDAPEGADIDYLDQLLQRIEFAIAGVKDSYGRMTPEEAMAPKEHTMPDGTKYQGPSDLANIKNIYMRGTVKSGGGDLFSSNTPNHAGVRFVELQERSESTHDTLNTIRERVKNIAGGKVTVTMQEEGPPTGAPINIEISGENFTVLGEIAKKVKAVLAGLPHVEDVRDNFVEGSPSIQVNVDRQKAALFGLSTNTIGFALKSAYNGLEVSSFREGDEDFDITLQLQEGDRKVVDILHELLLPTPSGTLIPLSTLATVTFSGTIGNINRINNSRVVTVKANVDETKIPGPVARAHAEEIFQKLVQLPPGYQMKFTGEFEFQQESQAFLGKAFVVALFIIFLILVSMFNSLAQPFIIMTSVLLSLGGAFLGLVVLRMPFGIIMTGVGIISLAGVVVNNAIVLIDYTNKLRERGYELKEAIISAGCTRLRPVLLTAVTTILGLIPMLTGVSYDFHQWAVVWSSESSQWWRSMAAVVTFGLLVATFLTLVVVPTIYYALENAGTILDQFRKWIQKIYWKPVPYLAGEVGPHGSPRRKT
jgi:multidrug efflux pump subunit AcrB